MTSAILRLLTIIAGTAFVVVLAGVFVRWAGSHQEYSEPPHEWFANPNWTLSEVSLDRFCRNPNISVTVPDGTIATAEIHHRPDGWALKKCEFFVPPKALLEHSDHRQWLVVVDSKETTSLKPLVAELSAFDKSKSFGIFSTSQIVARYLRKEAPQWVYGADPATMLRLHMFTSFGIETVFDFWPDFVVQVPGDKNSELTERELSELKRRKKRIIQMR